jgi:hypothetical protein
MTAVEIREESETALGFLEDAVKDAQALSERGHICNPTSHRAVVRMGVGLARVVGSVSRRLDQICSEVESLPKQVTEEMREAVAMLVQGEVERVVETRLPPPTMSVPTPPPGGSVLVASEPQSESGKGVLSVTTALFGGKAGLSPSWASVMVAFFATVSWVGWLVAKGRGWL